LLKKGRRRRRREALLVAWTRCIKAPIHIIKLYIK
jgi:hypothetical protein